jgi:hypothetical protein
MSGALQFRIMATKLSAAFPAGLAIPAPRNRPLAADPQFPKALLPERLYSAPKKRCECDMVRGFGKYLYNDCRNLRASRRIAAPF